MGVTVAPDTVQIDGVQPSNDTASPDVAVADRLIAAPTVPLAGGAKAIDCPPPATSAGVYWFAEVPVPSWPFWPHPQHFTLPVVRTAQVWEPPAVIAATPLESPTTLTGTSLSSPVAWLSPSWPLEFEPQHFTPPVVVSAHVCESPAAMAATPLVSPDTFTGVRRCVNELSPSWPTPLLPQHFTPPPVV